MSSGVKRHKRVSPMPVTSSFPPRDMSKTYSEPVSYVLSEEQLADIILKYGAPTMPLSSRRPHSGMHEQRYKPTKGEKRK
jgi:hypothetical protein